MKIHQFKKYSALALASALSLSLASCNDTSAKITGYLSSKQIQENTNPTDDEKSKDKIVEGNLEVSVLGHHLSIQKIESSIDFQASDALYERINAMLIAYEIDSIKLSDLEDEINLSRLNLEPIRILNISRCSEHFDVSALNGKYEIIEFLNTPANVATEIINRCDCSEAYVKCSNFVDSPMEYDGPYMDINQFAHNLVNNNIKINGLIIEQFSYGIEHQYMEDNFGLTEETIQTLCQVNTNRLDIDSVGNKDVINLDLIVNEKIEVLRLGLPNYVESWVGDIQKGEIGTVKISASKPFQIYFRNIEITENTHFELPDDCIIYFNNTEYTDVTPFYDLKDASIFIYTSPAVDSIIYNKNCDDFNETVEQIKRINKADKEKIYF